MGGEVKYVIKFCVPKANAVMAAITIPVIAAAATAFHFLKKIKYRKKNAASGFTITKTATKIPAFQLLIFKMSNNSSSRNKLMVWLKKIDAVRFGKRNTRIKGAIKAALCL